MSNVPELAKNTETVSISIPSWIVELIDRYCAERDMSRSAVITRATRQFLLVHQDSPATWERIYQLIREK